MKRAPIDLHDDASAEVDKVTVEPADSRIDFHAKIARGQCPGHAPLRFRTSTRAAPSKLFSQRSRTVHPTCGLAEFGDPAPGDVRADRRVVRTPMAYTVADRTASQ
ncbi:hypothetical protein BJD99_11115 [Rhodococcus sp. 1163]|nr:hypothetical protein BJD99_11115 [Rhodococcus sp. 1163]